jgi:hypothetical protein
MDYEYINPATKYRKPWSRIGRRNKLTSEKDSGQAGMTAIRHLIAGVIIMQSTGMMCITKILHSQGVAVHMPA